MTEKRTMEIEAKFIVPDEATLHRLLEMRKLGGFRLEPGPTKLVSDSYRDTADRAIYRGGYACRIRSTGDEQIATLKGLGMAEGAVHERAEYEVTLDAGEAPVDWPASPARQLALALSQGEPLIELFSLSQQRHTRTVRAGDRRVAELSLDVVEMHIGDEVKTTLSATLRTGFEVEVELAPAGTPADLALMVADLRDGWRLQPQTRSKFEQGLAALTDNVIRRRLLRHKDRASR
jgi:inorganic triphosphatase YgiF